MESRWIRVIANHNSDGLQDRDGNELDPATLPISASLRERLMFWKRRFRVASPYRAFEGAEPGTAAYDEATSKMDTFAAEGLAIAKALKAELPTATIYYFDEGEIARADYSGPFPSYSGVLIENP